MAAPEEKSETVQYLLDVRDATIVRATGKYNPSHNEVKIQIVGARGGLKDEEKLRFDEAMKRVDNLETLLKKVLDNERKLILENENLKREFEVLQQYFVTDWSKTRMGDFGNKYNEV